MKGSGSERRASRLTRHPCGRRAAVRAQAYLEDFAKFCQKVGGSTAEVMNDILTLEADRRAINITVNSIDTELDMKQRESLYPSMGLLYPEGTSRLARATDLDAVRAAIDAYPDYRSLLTDLGFDEEKSLEDQVCHRGRTCARVACA